MCVVLLAIVVLIVSVVVNFFVNLRRLNAKLQCFVCPPQHFLLGHALQFNSTTKILSGLQNIKTNYGNVVRVNTGFFCPFLLVTDVKFLEFLLTSTKTIEKSVEYNALKKWLGTGLLTSNTKKWSQTRKIITPAFHFQILEQFIEVFNSASEILIEKLESSGEKALDIYPYMTAFTFDIICETAMGTTINAQKNEDSDYANSVREMGRIFAQRGFEPLKHTFLFLLTKDYWKEKRAVGIIHEYNKSVIDKRKKEKPIEIGVPAVDAFGRKRRLAFLDLLLQSKLDGRPMTDKEIMDEVNTFMFAGFDTTSIALTFTLYCLSCNIDVQEKMVDELRNIFSDDKFRPVAYRDLQEMKYMDMVIKESLRIFPPVPLFARELQNDEPYYGGILPAKVPITVFTYGLHRDPELYPMPEKFDPERFTPENQAKRNPFSYIPFSAGPRNCIGQRFAMFEMKSTIANLLRKFEVVPVPEHRLVLSFETVLKSKTGVQIKLKPRIF